MRFPLRLVAAGLAAAGSGMTENFIGSCDASTVQVSGRILTASCRNIFGALRCSRLDLGQCLKNTYGSLQADPAGTGPHFGDQCVECSNSKTLGGILLGDNPSLVHCQCDPGTGASQASWPTAIFDLNTVVDNNNGVLECYRTKGSPC
ncbi:hypothetical protein B0T26DRAFT_747839 [Lasiosphaeria miniovina]|uniref:Cyanovirin-N domain-containing protein n=1 Tax=Lasiosphaeria miniovina TaxID=1954250 RepID=A0AA40B4N1_9PEZI|nr:uncharacterized protein B0T26DRAFT_747839 [Lasiosphaeria miniovina]KAK0727527.1 hypothetical protein B0T26DRAFT_747839 [Lasiosphaeria miniovina]